MRDTIFHEPLREVGLARWAGPARAERAEPFSSTFYTFMHRKV